MAADDKHDLAAVCSLFCPGLGQVVKGEFAKAAAFFGGSLLCLPLALIFWPWSVIDAYNYTAPARAALPAGAGAAAGPPDPLADLPPIATGAYKALGLVVFLLGLGAMWVLNLPSWTSVAAYVPWWVGLFPVAFGGSMVARAFRVDVDCRRERERRRIARLERDVLRLAQRRNGRVTSVDVATECGSSLDEARELLDRLARKGHVGVTVSDDGVFVYKVLDMVPEIVAPSAGPSAVLPEPLPERPPDADPPQKVTS